jgi:ABC-type sulfate/molybdate transport systems ATPase subunit
MLDRFRLAEFAGRYPHEISGGQKQRCSIARALVVRPHVLLLDEPARGLDAPLREDLYDLLRELRRDFRVPMLLVTHDLEAAFAVGDEMLVFEAGRIPQRGKPSDVLGRPVSEDVARLFGYSTFLEAEVVKVNPGENCSRLRFFDCEFCGPCVSGSLVGDRIRICVRPDELRLADAPGSNRTPAVVVGVEPRPQGVRLRLAVQSKQTLIVDVPGAHWDAVKDRAEHYVEIPPYALHPIR